MKKLALLCDMSTDTGGAERYWATIVPQLRDHYDIALYSRIAGDNDPFGIPATHVSWSDEYAAPSRDAATQVERALRDADIAITANVFDELVLQAVRASSARWMVKIHDHRVYCPNGNKVYPQFPAICTVPMGAACVANTLIHGCVQGPRFSSMRRIAQRMRVRDTMVRADTTITSGPYMRGLCIQNGFDPSRIQMMPPPLADDFFADLRLAPGDGVLYAGRIEEEKGLMSLVRAIAMIPPERRPTLAVAGRGSETYQAEVQANARRLNVRMDLLGFLGQRELRDAMDRARIFAFPSLWPEPFGISGTQALARGRPVAAYDVGGVSAWTKDAGIAVARGDERSLAAAIERLCVDDGAWTRAAGQAIEQSQQYRVNAHLDKLLEIIEGT